MTAARYRPGPSDLSRSRCVRRAFSPLKVAPVWRRPTVRSAGPEAARPARGYASRRRRPGAVHQKPLARPAGAPY